MLKLQFRLAKRRPLPLQQQPPQRNKKPLLQQRIKILLQQKPKTPLKQKKINPLLLQKGNPLVALQKRLLHQQKIRKLQLGEIYLVLQLDKGRLLKSQQHPRRHVVRLQHPPHLY